MKTFFLSLCCLVCTLGNTLFAQTDLAEGSLLLYGALGGKSLGVDGDFVALDFTDDSPSRDNITTAVSLTENNFSFLAGLGISYFFKDNIEGHIEVNGLFGQSSGLQFGLGAGYMMPVGNMSLILGLDLGVYSYQKYLGDIINNDLYIQINSTQIYERSARTYYSNTCTTLKPNVKLISKDFNGKGWHVFGSVGYDALIARGSAKLVFSGEDEGGEVVTDSKEVSSFNFNYFEVDGVSNFDSILDASGVSFRIGLIKTIGE